MQWPGGCWKSAHVHTYSHSLSQWKVLSPEGRLLGVHTGESATITILDNGCRIVFNVAPEHATAGTGGSGTTTGGTWGAYRLRGEAMGMGIWVS